MNKIIIEEICFRKEGSALHLKYVDEMKSSEIILSNELARNNNIIYSKVLLHIGYLKKEVSVRYVDNWPADKIGLPRNLSRDFVLPDTLPYKIRFEKRNIYIGPVIGMLFAAQQKTLMPEYLKAHNCYLLSYSETGGLVFIGSSEGINAENQTIKGFYYNPDSTEKWVEGVFPYPAALYRRVEIPDKKYDDLVKNIGDSIFNTYYFDKWGLWQCLSPYEEINQHLPHTEKLTTVDTLMKMLEQYHTVYLKRISSEQSKGIYRVMKIENGYQFIDKEKNEFILGTTEEVSKFLNKIKRIYGTYLIQAAIKVKNFENRSFDIRVILQKDESKQWTCTGMIARFGGEGSVASIIRLGGLAMQGKEALKQVFNMTEDEVFVKEREIINICTKACELLDKSIGNYGDLGLDVIIDENQKIWILEINKNHYHYFPVYALKDRKMYYDITSKPLKYANTLSGF
jgi:hypothetical protein